MEHRQMPLVRVVAMVDELEENAQERRAWARMACACEAALNDLHPHHPQRGEFVAMWTDCRRAAGLHLERGVSQTA